MAFDFAAVKQAARRIVHQTFALDAEYWYNDGDVPVALRVRWHNKLTNVGDPNNEGYPVTIDTIDKVIFDIEELAAKTVVVARGGRVKILHPAFGGQVLAIDTRDPRCGPTDQVWYVAKIDNGSDTP
jgi:hypothetical protein